jgi:hypothetical protein
LLFLHPPERAEEAKTALAQMIAERSILPRPRTAKNAYSFPPKTHVSLGEWNGQPAFFGITQDTTLWSSPSKSFQRRFTTACCSGDRQHRKRTHIEVTTPV